MEIKPRVGAVTAASGVVGRAAGAALPAEGMGFDAVVLVEGVSDQVAVEVLAERRGRDLAVERIAVVPIGGATSIRSFLDRFGSWAPAEVGRSATPGCSSRRWTSRGFPGRSNVSWPMSDDGARPPGSVGLPPHLPPLALEDWRPTKDTLHLWAQIVGKVRLALMPMRNHWWNVTLYPSARGLTTRRLSVPAHNLEIEIDLVDHRLRARTTAAEVGFDLHDGLPVADFHQQLTDTLGALDVSVEIRAEPFGVPTTTPFADDREHASYDREAVTRYLSVLQWSSDVFEEFSGWYCGKTSPVHVFWHSFDLAVSRFSGRRVPTDPDADAVTAEAYSHEVISFGFWAGDPVNPFPAYYSYTAPEPPGLRDQALRPPAAEWLERGNGSLAILRYDDVRSASDPKATLLDFLQSGFEAGGSLAGWDLAGTAAPWCPVPPERLTRLSR